MMTLLERPEIPGSVVCSSFSDDRLEPIKTLQGDPVPCPLESPTPSPPPNQLAEEESSGSWSLVERHKWRNVINARRVEVLVEPKIRQPPGVSCAYDKRAQCNLQTGSTAKRQKKRKRLPPNPNALTKTSSAGSSCSTRETASKLEALLLNLSKRTKCSLTVLLQLEGKSGETITMGEVERVMKELQMKIVNGKGAQFKVEPTLFGLNQPNLTFHRATTATLQLQAFKGGAAQLRGVNFVESPHKKILPGTVKNHLPELSHLPKKPGGPNNAQARPVAITPPISSALVNNIVSGGLLRTFCPKQKNVPPLTYAAVTRKGVALSCITQKPKEFSLDILYSSLQHSQTQEHGSSDDGWIKVTGRKARLISSAPTHISASVSEKVASAKYLDRTGKKPGVASPLPRNSIQRRNGRAEHQATVVSKTAPAMPRQVMVIWDEAFFDHFREGINSDTHETWKDILGFGRRGSTKIRTVRFKKALESVGFKISHCGGSKVKCTPVMFSVRSTLAFIQALLLKNVRPLTIRGKPRVSYFISM
ncbi:hypothetical protein BDV93DRAFT_558629 [Ceratobasidium sp. AG-I]|nr:hypothetical protein BDV93DRAFT_558629 [Ceratobasidium sp. AG-I]